jgi:two-component system, chemotaxis family, protein-glutamate methylesterase/glutaminase
LRKHRVLIVDDSRSMRQLIAHSLSSAFDIEVVGEAADAYEAREAIKALDPDVVTLDVEMPKMTGLDFLEKLMRLRPTPVIMISTHTGPRKELTLQALEIGAIDCIAKPQPGDANPFEGLVAKVRDAANIKFKPATSRSSGERCLQSSPASNYVSDGRVIAIGSSAGGVDALCTVLPSLPSNCAPVVVTQHMPATFTSSLARRLDRICKARVSEAEDGAPLENGVILLAPGGMNHLTVVGSKRLTCRLTPGEAVSGHRPSVDVMFHSVARTVGSQAVGVILTGMGRDGADGLLAMRRAGASTLGQDAASSFIYGMPRAAFEAGSVERQLPLTQIGEALTTMTAQSRELSQCP